MVQLQVGLPAVYRGKLVDCFRMFAMALARKFPKGIKGSVDGRRPIADFCKVSPDTITGWCLRSFSAKGEEWFRMAFYLEMHGYNVTELTRMERSCRSFVELLVYGILDIPEAMRILEYQNVSTMFAMFRGDTRPPPEKIERMWGIWKERKSSLEEIKEQVRGRCLIDLPKEEVEELQLPTTLQVQEEPIEMNTHVEATFDIMAGLLKLLDAKPFDQLTENDRRRIFDSSRREGKLILQMMGHFSLLGVRVIKD